MNKFMNSFINLLSRMKNNKGQGMVEYGLIIGLIAVVLIVALGAMSGGLQKIFGNISSALGIASTASPTPLP